MVMQAMSKILLALLTLAMMTGAADASTISLVTNHNHLHPVACRHPVGSAIDTYVTYPAR